jgi:hypothetical protein
MANKKETFGSPEKSQQTTQISMFEANLTSHKPDFI